MNKIARVPEKIKLERKYKEAKSEHAIDFNAFAVYINTYTAKRVVLADVAEIARVRQNKRAVRSCGKLIDIVNENQKKQVFEREVVIGNKMGLHSRPAAMIARMVADFKGEVSLVKCDSSGESADCRSVLSMLILAVGKGTRLILRVSGEGADELAEKLSAFFGRNFDEESE